MLPRRRARIACSPNATRRPWNVDRLPRARATNPGRHSTDRRRLQWHWPRLACGRRSGAKPRPRRPLPRGQPLGFDNGRERLTIHLTLLHHKCVRQQRLEKFTISNGIVTHTQSAAILRLQNWVGFGGRAGEPVSRPADAVSHRANALSMGQYLMGPLPEPRYERTRQLLITDSFRRAVFGDAPASKCPQDELTDIVG